MFSELIDALLMLGTAQSLFLAVVLATKRTNSAANKVLAVAMLSFSIFVVRSLFYERGHYLEYPQFIGFSVSIIYLFGPVLYLYAKSVSMGGHVFKRSWLLHFLPFALTALYFLPFYFKSGEWKLAYLNRVVQKGPPLDLAVIQNLQMLHGIVYVVLTILLLKRHREHLRDTHSYIERINLAWLRNLTIGIVAVWGIATVQWVLENLGLSTGSIDAKQIPLAVSMFACAVGYFGLRQPELFGARTTELVGTVQTVEPTVEDAEEVGAAAHNLVSSAVAHNSGTAATNSVSSMIATNESAGYERSGLTQAQAEQHVARLVAIMNEKALYKNSLLTLQDLADELRISQHHLSQVINTQLGKNFYDFVNGYRIEEAMRRMRDPKSSELTILSIAYQSGFNTKSSFNTFFKKYTGVTPSQFRGSAREAA